MTLTHTLVREYDARNVLFLSLYKYIIYNITQKTNSRWMDFAMIEFRMKCDSLEIRFFLCARLNSLRNIIRSIITESKNLNEMLFNRVMDMIIIINQIETYTQN